MKKLNIVITGGTRGIGQAISKTYLQQGHQVFALYARNKKGAEQLLEEAKDLSGECHVLRGDLTKEEKLAEIVQELEEKTAGQGIDGLIHCAASGVHKKIEDLSTKNLRWTFEINFFVFHELFLRLRQNFNSGARIVGLTSSGGRKYLSHYAAVGSSKGALESLLRHYAVELAPKNMAVYLVCPGMVDTEALKAFPDREIRIEKARQTTPTGRLTTVEDVADFVYRLNSIEHNQLSGQTFEIDGARSFLA